MTQSGGSGQLLALGDSGFGSVRGRWGLAGPWFIEFLSGQKTFFNPKPLIPTLLETNMETQKGPYKDYSASKMGLYGFPC